MSTHTCPPDHTPIDSLGGPLCVADQWLVPGYQDPAECTNGFFQGSCVPPPPTTTTLPADTEVECFVLVGGTPCFPVGSAEAGSAAAAEDEYLCSTGNINELGGCEPVGQGEEPGRPAAGPIAIGDHNIEADAPDLGECYDGITEFGFQPCEMVAIGPPPPVEVLPATGVASVLLAAAICITGLGLALRQASRKPPPKGRHYE